MVEGNNRGQSLQQRFSLEEMGEIMDDDNGRKLLLFEKAGNGD